MAKRKRSTPTYHPTTYPGVRYREHPTRKHGVKKDRYFAIYYKIDGKRYDEGLGWSSEGWSAVKANRELATLKEAHRTGRGAFTLKQSRESKLKENKKLERDALTFSHLFEKLYLPHAKDNKSESSWQREESLFDKWIDPVIGGMPLKDVSPIALEKIKSKMNKAGRAPRTIQYCFAVIRQVFNWAKRNDLYLGDSPTSKVTWPKQVDNKRDRFLTHEEATQLLEVLASRSEDVHHMALLALHTGARAGEIFSLTWGDIDFKQGLVNIRDSKGGKNRAVFLTDAAKNMLKARERGKKTDLIFAARDGQRITEISNTFDRAVDQLKFNDGVKDDRRQKVVFHTLRHTHASWMVQAGVDLYTVQKLLGHATLAMTQRYAHLAPDTFKGAVKVLEKSMKAHEKKVVDNIKGVK